MVALNVSKSSNFTVIKVLILDDNSEIGAHV